MSVIARRPSMSLLQNAEPLLEDLPFSADALANLARQSGVPASTFGDEEGWQAAVEIEGTAVLVAARGETWTILAPPDADPGDAMQAARRLHGLLGEKTEDWDEDR